MALKKTKAASKAKPKKAASKKAKKAPAKKKAVAQATAKDSAVVVDNKELDRKALAAHARQVKKELLSIRFNLQSPSLKEYRRKKSELQKFLSQLN
jgi:hypothetical protein